MTTLVSKSERTIPSPPAPLAVAPGEAALLVVPPPPTPPKIEWRRAWRAMRQLIADPEETEQAFEAIAALSGWDFERLFQRFVAHPDGRTLFVERPSLLDALSDRAALRRMPEGSFGRAYAEFMDAAGLDAQGLVEAEEKSVAASRFDGVDPVREWFGHRVRDMHDLWHVLSGYGRDQAGEAANLAFSFAQTPFRGVALILFGIVVNRPPDGHTRVAWLRYLYRAWKRGRNTAWLPAIPYERLLPRSLDVVRQSLRIQPADETHPEGVIVANMYFANTPNGMPAASTTVAHEPRAGVVGASMEA